MNSIQVTLEVSKINKAKITERKYINAEKQEVVVKEFKVEVVELKPEKQKVISTGDGWVLKKTHFVVEAKTKEEKAAKTPSVYVGEGFQFISDEKAPVDTGASTDINTEDIPF